MMTDPIADMLTRIRNAVAIERSYVDVPHSNLKAGLAAALQREGYIWEFVTVGEGTQKVLRLTLKYGANGEKVISSIRRISKPGCRVYKNCADLGDVLQGLGIYILSTSSGVISSREAKEKGIGGEVLCEVY
jgi:small subunit ribosomal protein S8